MAWPVKRKCGRKTRWYVYDAVMVDGKPKDKCIGGGFHLKEHAYNFILQWDLRKARNHGSIIDYDATIWQYCDKYYDLPKTRTLNCKRIILDAIKQVKKYFDQKFRLIDLTEDIVEDFIKSLLKEYAHSTTHIHLRNFSAVLNLAVRKHILDFNPLVGENPKAGLLAMLGEPPGREVFLTDIEVQRLYQAAMSINMGHRWGDKARNLEFCNVIKVFLNTGLRRAELVNLAKEHMISEYEIIIPSRRKKMRGNLTATKSPKEYVYPLNTAIVSIFNDVAEGRIFSKWSEFMIEKTFRRVADKAGLTELTPHGLRHTFASNFLKSGGKLEELQILLNHSSIKTTMKYAHLEKGRLKERVDAMVRESEALKVI